MESGNYLNGIRKLVSAAEWGRNRGTQILTKMNDHHRHSDTPSYDEVASMPSTPSYDEVASMPSQFSHINPLKMLTAFEAGDARAMGRRTGSADSPTSVVDVNRLWGGASDREAPSPYGEEKPKGHGELLEDNDETDTDSQIFRTLDRVLSYLPEDEEGVEVDDTSTLCFDHRNQPQGLKSEESHISRESVLQDGHAAIPFGDVRILSLGLVGHGHVSIAATIVRKSLERHFEFVLKSNETEMAHESKNENSEAERMARNMILSRRFEEAVALYRRMEVAKGRRGNTSNIYSYLSILYAIVGNERESLRYAKRLLKHVQANGDQPGSGISLVLVGLVYLRFGHNEKALNTFKEALQIVILVFGYDHTYVAMLLNNLACLHYLQGNFAMSLQLFSESIDLNRKVLRTPEAWTDAVILDISIAKGNIAMILARSGNFDAAVGLLEEVLSLQESMSAKPAQSIADETQIALERIGELGGAPAGTSTTKFFGSMLSETTAIRTVDTFQEIRIEETKPSVFGNDDGIPMRRSGNKSPIDAIDSSDNLNALFLGPLVNEYTPSQRVRAAILEWFDKTLKDEERDTKLPFVPFQATPRKRTRIPIDIDTNEAIDAELHLPQIIEQAQDHLEHGEIEEALELFQSSLYSHKEKFGERHHLVGMAMHNIGMIYLYAEKYPLALKSFQEATTLQRAALGSAHPAVAASLMNIGMIFLLQRNPRGGKEAFLRAMDVTRKSMGYGSIQMARVLNNLGVAHYDSGDYSEALQSFLEARDIQRNLLHMAMSEGGILRSQTRTIGLALTGTLSNLGFLYCRQRKYLEAFEALKEANELRERHGGILARDPYSLEANLQYVGGIVREMKPKESLGPKEIQEPASDHTPFMIFASFIKRMRCDLQ